MKSFEEEYRSDLDRIGVPPGFAASVRERAAARTPHAKQEHLRTKRKRPRRIAAIAAAAAVAAVAAVGVTFAVGSFAPPSVVQPVEEQAPSPEAPSFGLRVAAYADEGAAPENDATLTGVVAQSGSGGYAVYYRRGDPIASRYCYDASFQIDLTCTGDNIERVDYEVLGTNGMVASTDVGWVGDYPAPDGFDGLAYFRLDGETDANGAPLFGNVTSFSVSATEATTDARRRLMIVVPMTPDRDELAYELGASATPETQDEIDMQIFDLGLASCYERLSDVRIAVTAHFTDGSEQTKTYRISIVGDADEEAAKQHSMRSLNSTQPYRPAFAVEEVAE